MLCDEIESNRRFVGSCRKGPANIVGRQFEACTELANAGESVAVVARQPLTLEHRKVGLETFAKARDRVAARAPREVGIEQRATDGTQLGLGPPHDPIEADHLGVRRQGRRHVEQLREVLAVQGVVARVVEVPEPSRREVEFVQHDGGLAVGVLVVGAGGVGQPEGIGLDAEQLACPEVLDRVGQHRAPDGEFLDVDAIERTQIAQRRFEEGPLVTFEIHPEHERQARARLQALRVEQLDPQVGVAVLLDPDAVGAVQRMAAMIGRTQPRQDGQTTHHAGQSRARTPAGHVLGSKPWVLISASVTRSRPKPRHAVLATSPLLERMPKVPLK